LASFFRWLANRVALVDSTQHRTPGPTSVAGTEFLKDTITSDTNQTAPKRRPLEHIAQARKFDRGTDALGSSRRLQSDRADHDARSPKFGERLGSEMSGNSTQVETM
jgi:hypothetical protein